MRGCEAGVGARLEAGAEAAAGTAGRRGGPAGHGEAGALGTWAEASHSEGSTIGEEAESAVLVGRRAGTAGIRTSEDKMVVTC